jgi:DNA-binding transcriptional LysR family regulator
MGAAAEDLTLAATGQSQAVDGVVSVSASDAVAAHLLPRLVRRLRQQEPGIVVEVVASNALSDLRRREADIAIRHVRPDQPDLIGRFIREAQAGFYASAGWVQQHGHPRTATEAARLPSSVPTARAVTWPTCASTVCRWRWPTSAVTPRTPWPTGRWCSRAWASAR